MINLKRIVEQQGSDGQYYDLGRDFANFRRTIDGSFEQVKQRFEQIIGAKLNGKRIHARASRGYKQYVKDYEFDVSTVSIDDYYDNYVAVAHDNSTPKPKEYFLKPGFKIQILGPASGQPSPQKDEKPGEKPNEPAPKPMSPKQNPDKAQSQPMAQAPAGAAPTASDEPVKEGDGGGGAARYDAYPIDAIVQDVKSWLPRTLLKSGDAVRDFVKGLGWLKNLGHGKSVALFDLKVPIVNVSPNVSQDSLKKIIDRSSTRVGNWDTKYELMKMEPDTKREDYIIRIKKTMTNTGV
jgi:hypothetical protein